MASGLDLAHFHPHSFGPPFRKVRSWRKAQGGWWGRRMTGGWPVHLPTFRHSPSARVYARTHNGPMRRGLCKSTARTGPGTSASALVGPQHAHVQAGACAGTHVPGPFRRPTFMGSSARQRLEPCGGPSPGPYTCVHDKADVNGPSKRSLQPTSLGSPAGDHMSRPTLRPITGSCACPR